MDAELKERWLEALESGRYSKGRGHLRDVDNNYCCLGVLCDIVDPSEWRIDKYNYRYIRNKSVLPFELVPLIGKHDSSLMSLNDDNDTFQPVIDYIRENL